MLSRLIAGELIARLSQPPGVSTYSFKVKKRYVRYARIRSARRKLFRVQADARTVCSPCNRISPRLARALGLSHVDSLISHMH